MVETASTMISLGTRCPEFSLPDVFTGRTITFATFEKTDALLVVFISRHCPFVKHVRHEIAEIGRDYDDKRLGIVAISSNDINNYPDDSPENLSDMARDLELTFPLCFDETQDTAKAFQAACTPDFFLFDGDRSLVYRGQLDDSRPGSNIPVNGKSLRGAINSVMEKREVDPDQKPSIGCNIKWKPGNEPRYFGSLKVDG